MAAAGGANTCPIPKEVLLHMVKEEKRLRLSKEFQHRMAREEASEETDSAGTITKMQVSLP